ncbi:hypothetical protein LAZ67_X003890 [Cordylochernes scorpioides]|uniref:Reverse transcriptase zinc-binding domain-containing protein n=1 Tax=Cordylochernes scorpioides TaxID=51811 RepID=A0ABY6LUX7_9ARAC|nr:hypothetical protein LAZ67_X003890 [Cordylochernes scorpioides]
MFAELEVLENSLFFTIKGFIDIEKLEDQKTVISDWYTTKCLPEVFEKSSKADQELNLRTPIWACDQKELLDKTQDVFLRRLLNLPRYTPGYNLRMECGRTSLAVTFIKLTMKYWIRILNMIANQLPFKCLTELMNLSRNSNIHIGLVKTINDILNSTGFSYLINCTDKDFLQHELPLIIRTTIDQSIQGDWARINNTKLYPHYRNLKKTSLPEGYLSDNLPFIVKRHIAQLRVLHTFFRENHKNIFGEAELLCKFCKQKMNSEISHYFFHCTSISDERKTFISKQDNRIPDTVEDILTNYITVRKFSLDLCGFYKAVNKKASLTVTFQGNWKSYFNMYALWKWKGRNRIKEDNPEDRTTLGSLCILLVAVIPRGGSGRERRTGFKKDRVE